MQIDSLCDDGTKSWVLISRGVDRYVTGNSAGCMCPETVAQQDASLSTEQSVADMAFATRSKAKTSRESSAEPSSPPVKLPPPHLTGKVKSSVQDEEIQCHPPNIVGRDPLLDQTISSKPKETQSRQFRRKKISSKGSSIQRHAGDIYGRADKQFL